ncbi:hypothetical protein Ddye_005480 [Dipteronia dyeriana]|uniref:Zinc knuckle CX2CX4HX4C domain-containing protein n=1 Tax=Dipteronia dyeriana TaxID=168575 RepID=A0AAE0CPR2_9ROSI|nr:hypothetical protein Ddye_005480 [Dipteronia dyeriana]
MAHRHFGKPSTLCERERRGERKRDLAKGICVPLRLDKATIDGDFRHFARVLMDVNISLSPLTSLLLERDDSYSSFISVEYENLLTFCSTCSSIGHLSHACGWNKFGNVSSCMGKPALIWVGCIGVAPVVPSFMSEGPSVPLASFLQLSFGMASAVSGLEVVMVPPFVVIDVVLVPNSSYGVLSRLDVHSSVGSVISSLLDAYDF